jgi:hypothetical protein
MDAEVIVTLPPTISIEVAVVEPSLSVTTSGGLPGPPGDKGPEGPAGPPGPEGDASLWYTGTGAPTDSTLPQADSNDLYLDLLTGNIYTRRAPITRMIPGGK